MLELIDTLRRTDKYRLFVVALLTLGLPLVVWIDYYVRKQSLLQKNSCVSAFSSSGGNIFGDWSKIPFFAWFQAYQPCIIAVIHYMIGLSLLYRFFCFLRTCWRHRNHCHASGGHHPTPSSASSGGLQPNLVVPHWNTSLVSSDASQETVSRPFFMTQPTRMSPGNYHIRLSACSQRKVTTLNKAPTVYFLSFDTESSLVQLMDSPKRWFLNRHSELNSENSTLRIESDSGLGYMVTCSLRNTTDSSGATEGEDRNHTNLCGSGLVLQTDGLIAWGDSRVLCWVRSSNPDTPDEIAWKLPSASTDFVPLRFAFVPL